MLTPRPQLVGTLKPSNGQIENKIKALCSLLDFDMVEVKSLFTLKSPMSNYKKVLILQIYKVEFICKYTSLSSISYKQLHLVILT